MLASHVLHRTLARLNFTFIFFPQACYGRHDDASVEKVKALYNTLQMPTLYQRYEDESYQRLQKLITSHAQNLPHSVFHNFAMKIYKRDKWEGMVVIKGVRCISLFPFWVLSWRTDDLLSFLMRVCQGTGLWILEILQAVSFELNDICECHWTACLLLNVIYIFILQQLW